MERRNLVLAGVSLIVLASCSQTPTIPVDVKVSLPPVVQDAVDDVESIITKVESLATQIPATATSIVSTVKTEIAGLTGGNAVQTLANVATTLAPIINILAPGFGTIASAIGTLLPLIAGGGTVTPTAQARFARSTGMSVTQARAILRS